MFVIYPPTIVKIQTLVLKILRSKSIHRIQLQKKPANGFLSVPLHVDEVTSTLSLSLSHSNLSPFRQKKNFPVSKKSEYN